MHGFKQIYWFELSHRLLATLALISIALLQGTLGISTLLLHVPVSLVTTHQAGALLLLTVVLFVNQRMVRAGKVQD